MQAEITITLTLKLCECGCGNPTPIAKKNRYDRGWKKGDGIRFISGHNNREAVRDRFIRKIIKTESDCWQWIGAHTPEGYGRIMRNGRSTPAHRVAWEIFNGPIPQGLSIDHLCRNHGCVNPEHLEPVTNRENILRGENFSAKNARKTHCIRNHAFSEANTYRDGIGRRYCRACRIIRLANVNS